MFKELEKNINLEGPRANEASKEKRVEMQKCFLDLDKLVAIFLSSTNKKNSFYEVCSKLNELVTMVHSTFPSYKVGDDESYLIKKEDGKKVSLISIYDDLDIIERFLWKTDIGLPGFVRAYKNLNYKLKSIEKDLIKKEKPELQVA